LILQSDPDNKSSAAFFYHREIPRAVAHRIFANFKGRILLPTIQGVKKVWPSDVNVESVYLRLEAGMDANSILPEFQPNNDYREFSGNDIVLE